MIELNNVTKKFKQKTVVNNVSFKINKNVIHGLLGPNGSGKTTTIKMIIGALKVSSGSITIAGFDHNNVKVKQLIGYVPESARFCRNISLKDYLFAMGRLNQLDDAINTQRVNQLIQNLNMTSMQKKSPTTFSSGMQKKVMIAQALLHDPKIIILDEPSANLDPMARQELFCDLKSLQKLGKTIVICSHALRELQGVVDEVSILSYSKLLYSGTIQPNTDLTELYCHYVKINSGEKTDSILKGLY